MASCRLLLASAVASLLVSFSQGLPEPSLLPTDDDSLEGFDWRERLRHSTFAVSMGVSLVLLGLGVLVWNEMCAVLNYRVFGRAKTMVHKNVDPDRAQLSLQGELIHVTGMVSSADNQAIVDPELGVVFADASRVKRVVEMYQWCEFTEPNGEVDYTRLWSSSALDSHRFRRPLPHANPEPDQWPIKQFERSAPGLMIGQQFRLSPQIVEQMNWYVPRPLTHAEFKTIHPHFKNIFAEGPYLYYGAGIPEQPVVGDVKITYLYVPYGLVSVMGRQVSNSFEPWDGPDYLESNEHDEEAPLLASGSGSYQSSHSFASQSEGTPSGSGLVRNYYSNSVSHQQQPTTTPVQDKDAILWVDEGSVGPMTMIQRRVVDNPQRVWMARLLAVLLLLSGLACVIGPIMPALAHYKLFAVLGRSVWAAALLMAALLTLLTSSICWSVYRPRLLVLSLLLTAGVVVFASI